MRRPHPLTRAAAAAMLVAWLPVVVAPAPGAAEETEAPAEEAETPAEEPAPPPVETHWYDRPVRDANVTVDLVLVRPLAFVTLAAGAALFVPAAIMTSPNGWDSIKDAYQRFIGEPQEYLISRPLGEF